MPRTERIAGWLPCANKIRQVNVYLPGNLTLEEAIQINNEAQVYEGVESIEPNGTVLLTGKGFGHLPKPPRL